MFSFRRGDKTLGNIGNVRLSFFHLTATSVNYISLGSFLPLICSSPWPQDCVWCSTFSSSPPVSSILSDYFFSLSSDGSHPLSNNDSLIGVKVSCNHFLHNRMHNYACALPLRANRPALSWALHLSLLVSSLSLLSLKCRGVFSLTNPCHKVAEQTVCWPEGEMMFSLWGLDC